MIGKIFEISDRPYKNHDLVEIHGMPAGVKLQLRAPLHKVDEDKREASIDALASIVGSREAGDVVKIKKTAVERYLKGKYDDFRDAVSKIVLNNTFDEYCRLGDLSEALLEANELFSDTLGYWFVNTTNGYAEFTPMDEFIRMDTHNKKWYIGSVFEYRYEDVV